MRFSVRPMLNPSGRFAGAEFDVETAEATEGLRLVYDTARFGAETREFLDAVQTGLSEYAAEPPEEFGPLPAAKFTLVNLEIHPKATDTTACRFVGVLAAREFHKRVFRDEC